jgi:hypothetical protein
MAGDMLLMDRVLPVLSVLRNSGRRLRERSVIESQNRAEPCTIEGLSWRQNGVPIDNKFIPDISFGQHWGKHWCTSFL